MVTGLSSNRRLPERSNGEIAVHYKEHNIHELLSNQHDNYWATILKNKRRELLPTVSKKISL
jgi:hypothetical protein